MELSPTEKDIRHFRRPTNHHCICQPAEPQDLYSVFVQTAETNGTFCLKPFFFARHRKEIFSVRGIARQKLGYYPLPHYEAERIRRFLSFHGDAVSVLDPCAGGGAAMATITSGAKTVRHAIELDAFRAEEAPSILNR